jgi:hypothetical protein
MTNAYQLADRLQELYQGLHVAEAAALLKKQADHIKYLEEQLDKSIEFVTKLNGEKR